MEITKLTKQIHNDTIRKSLERADGFTYQAYGLAFVYKLGGNIYESGII